MAGLQRGGSDVFFVLVASFRVIGCFFVYRIKKQLLIAELGICSGFDDFREDQRTVAMLSVYFIYICGDGMVYRTYCLQ